MDIMHTTGGRTASESETDATGGEEKTGHGGWWASSLSLALFSILPLSFHSPSFHSLSPFLPPTLFPCPPSPLPHHLLCSLPLSPSIFPSPPLHPQDGVSPQSRWLSPTSSGRGRRCCGQRLPSTSRSAPPSWRLWGLRSTWSQRTSSAGQGSSGHSCLSISELM